MWDGLSKLDGGSEGRFIENCDQQHFICSSWHTDSFPLTLVRALLSIPIILLVAWQLFFFLMKYLKHDKTFIFLPLTCSFCWNISLGRLYANIFLCSPTDPVDVEFWYQNWRECASTIQHGPREPITKPLLEYSTPSPAWPSVPQVYPFRALSDLSVNGDCVSDKYHRRTQCQVPTSFPRFKIK